MRIIDHAMVWVATAVVFVTAHHPQPALTEIGPAAISAYSCERGRETTGCTVTRWGGDVYAIGAACPPEWKDREIVIEGMEYLGALKCDDTPAASYLYGMPHIDVRLPTRQEAEAVGIQTLNVWEVTE